MEHAPKNKLMQKLRVGFLFTVLSFVSNASPPQNLQRNTASFGVLENAVALLSWLEQHASKFGSCIPTKVGDHYELCDKTRVDARELKQLFQKSPADLVSWLKTKGYKVEILCDASTQANPFKGLCNPSSERKMFEDLSSLHGQYLPQERTILIKSTASRGSLIHEYIHSLQAQNDREVYGKKYKKERIAVQDQLTQFMDSQIALISALEKQKKIFEAQSLIKPFTLASDAMRAFAPWQDLIDERGIFLLYLNHGQEFGAQTEDLVLAQKNMDFICDNPKLRPVLKGNQCAPRNQP